MLHIDKGGDNAATRRWVDAALANGIHFDILGESCYTRWQGPPESWQANFNDLVTRYPTLKFCIAELAADVQPANAIMQSLPNHKGLGTFIWEPTQNGNGQGLFTGGGRGAGGVMTVTDPRMALYDDLKKSLDTK
jgi:arabinogalactan endo-1,4-beta-galactosidase